MNPGGEKGSTNSGGAIEQFFTSVTSSVPSSDGNILTRMKSSAKQSPDGRRALLFPPFPAATSSGVAASKRKTTSADYNFEYDFELPPASQLDYAVLAEVQASLTNTDGSGGRVNNFGSRVSSSHTRLHSAGVGTATLATIAPRTDPCSGSSRSRSSSLISEEEGELSYSQVLNVYASQHNISLSPHLTTAQHSVSSNVLRYKCLAKNMFSVVINYYLFLRVRSNISAFFSVFFCASTGRLRAQHTRGASTGGIAADAPTSKEEAHNSS